MLLVLPGMAAAQSSSTFIVPFDRTGAPGVVDGLGNFITGAFNNPCTLEWVDVTGSSTVTVNQTAKDSKGEFKITVSVTSRGSGAGWVPLPVAPDPPDTAAYASATFTGSTYAFMENQSFRATVPFLLSTEYFDSAFSDKFALKGQGPTDNWVIRAYFRVKISGTGVVQVFIERMSGDVCKG
jgi:hypothetical protein